jgi:hypothetical protein
VTRPVVAPWELRLERAVLALGRDPWGSSGGGRAYGLLRVFRLVEDILHWGHALHSLQAGGVLRYEVAPALHTLPLVGEPSIRRGARVIRLHFNNEALARLGAQSSGSHAVLWKFTRGVVADLNELADLVAQGMIPADVQGAYGESLFYHAFERYGFTTRPTPRTLRTPFARLFLVAILAIYGQHDVAHVSRAQPTRLHVGEAWMSTQTLLRWYGAQARATRVTARRESATRERR